MNIIALPKASQDANVRRLPRAFATLNRLLQEAHSDACGLILIATRTYFDSDPATNLEHGCADYMYRKPGGGFVLKLTGGCPGEPESERTYELDEVYEWLNECPWQIARAVIRCSPLPRNES